MRKPEIIEIGKSKVFRGITRGARTMKTKQPKPKARKMWAVVTESGIIKRAYWSKELAKWWTRDIAKSKVICVTVTPVAPTKKARDK